MEKRGDALSRRENQLKYLNGARKKREKGDEGDANDKEGSKLRHYSRYERTNEKTGKRNREISRRRRTSTME